MAKKLFYEKNCQNGNFGFVFKIVTSLIVDREGFGKIIKKTLQISNLFLALFLNYVYVNYLRNFGCIILY